jgi:hypothetical protein
LFLASQVNVFSRAFMSEDRRLAIHEAVQSIIQQPLQHGAILLALLAAGAKFDFDRVGK